MTMTLIKSISGIRGTIGGSPGDHLTPIDIVECTAAYAQWLATKGRGHRVVLGRDARLSGEMVQGIVANTLVAMGFEVMDLGLSTTPTVEMAVMLEQAAGGIVITASHNPAEWNALKLLNHAGEFISAQDGEEILESIRLAAYRFSPVHAIGKVTPLPGYPQKHIAHILQLPAVRVEEVKARGFRVAADCVNSTGSLALPPLLDALGCSYKLLYDDVSGRFARNPEPLPEHLGELKAVMQSGQYDLGIAVDPDVDRLVFICEDGSPFGEEYTIVTLADYLLGLEPGPVVSNLSSTQALSDIAARYGQPYHAAAVGEVNVVTTMKEVGAVFGGEGNGGVIYPALHYGRDALVGVALMLSWMSTSGLTASALRRQLPDYSMAKHKVILKGSVSTDQVLEQLHQQYLDHPCDTRDGVKIHFDGAWVHLRKSNTEPIIRIYTESNTEAQAQELAQRFGAQISAMMEQTTTV